MSIGAAIVAAGAILAVGCAFPLRAHLPAALLWGLLGAAGAAIAWGGMLLQPEPSVGELVVAIVALGFLVPAHVRIVLGPFGPQK